MLLCIYMYCERFGNPIAHLSRVREFQCESEQRRQDNTLLETRGGPGNHRQNNGSVFFLAEVFNSYCLSTCNSIKHTDYLVWLTALQSLPHYTEEIWKQMHKVRLNAHNNLSRKYNCSQALLNTLEEFENASVDENVRKWSFSKMMTSQSCGFSSQVFLKHKFLWRSVEATVCIKKYSKLEKGTFKICTPPIRVWCVGNIDLTTLQYFLGGNLSLLRSAHSFPSAWL